MARNKLKRFLAGFCMAAMLVQTFGESGIAVMAADSEETVVEAVSDDYAEDTDEEEESTVSDNEEVSENALTEEGTDSVSADDTVSEDAAETENPSEDVDGDEEKLQGSGRIVEGGKVYDEESGTLLGTFNSSTGEFVVDVNLEVVPSFVFQGWEDIKSIKFVDGAKTTTLGHNTKKTDGAFAGCTSLTSVDLTKATKLTAIKLNCFDGCSSLASVKLNDGLNFIENAAFKDCALSEIEFGSKLIKIEAAAFEGCKNLHKIKFNSPNTTCEAGIFKGCAIDSFELGKNEKGTAVFPKNLFNKATFDETAVIEIGDSAVEISEGAFNSSNIVNVKLPKGLTVIGKNAFNACKKLAAIDFTPCKDSLDQISEGAFDSCISLKTLEIPDKVRKLGSSAFNSCSGLLSVKLGSGTKVDDKKPADVIGSDVFAGCMRISEIVFPEGLDYVGEEMFYGCSGLSKVEFSSTITTIGKGAFGKCLGLTSVELPANPAFTVVPAGCFAECPMLRTAELREGITEVGENAFKWCNSYISSLPSTLEKIGANAFNSASFCGTVVLPENITYIGAAAFRGCRDQFGSGGYKELSKVVINIDPNNDIKCGTGIFIDCLISEIELANNVDTIPTNLFNQTTWVTGKAIIIPKSVRKIGKGAFAGNPSLKENSGNLEEIVFEDGIQLDEIGEEAFAYNASLKPFTLPNTLKKIKSKAFMKCIKLNAITIPESVVEIGASAFEGCSLLEEVKFNAVAVTTSGKNIFKDCILKNIVLGTKVTILPDYLFDGAHFQQNSGGDYEFVSLTLPASLTRIGASSLTNVVNLKELKFASGSQLQTIGQSALSGCTGLVTIELPAALKSIENYAFQNCVSLSKVNLPASLETLGIGAFKGCVKITQTTIPEKITIVNKELYSGCSELSKVGFAGNNIASIGDSAFANCYKLKEIAIPTGVKTVGANAFTNCPLSGTIKLAEGATTIGANAFDTAGKEAKTVVYLPKSIKSIGKVAFNIAYKDNLSFYVVSGSYAEKWLKDNGFGDRIVGSSEAPKVYTVTFNLQGHGTAIPEAIVEEGKKVAKPDDPSEDGWIFGGWFTEKACKTVFDFETEITKNVTIYAKWDKGAEDIKGGYSALDPVPEITAATTDLWLVKGQKFNIGEGWKVDKAFKKYVSISKKGSFKAKKETPDTVKVIISHEGRKDITVHICKPVIDKKLPLVIETADQVKSGKINLAKDANIKNVLWYSASPDVATVDKDGNVTAVAKGTAKVTAYVNGSAYTCSVTVKETVPALKRTMHINSGSSKTIKIKGVKGTWTSADDAIATVNKKGKVSAVAPGKTTLTTNVNGTDYTIDVYVEDINVSGDGVVAGKPNKYTINLKKGEGTTLKFSDSLEQDVVFKSSKPGIAFVDENGKVVARSKGSSSLTTKINGKKVTITVKVTE